MIGAASARSPCLIDEFGGERLPSFMLASRYSEIALYDALNDFLGDRAADL